MNRIIAFGYRNFNEFRKEILVADLSGKVLWSRSNPDIRELYQDCLGDVYLVEKNSASQVVVRGDSIAVKGSCQRYYFNEFVRPVAAVTDSLTVFTRKSPNGQYETYFAIEGQDQEAELMYRAGDTRKESGYLQEFSIIRYSGRGALTGVTPMRIVFNNDWEQRMRKDPATGRYYLEFLNGQLSYLIEIDPATGDEVRKIPIQRYKHIMLPAWIRPLRNSKKSQAGNFTRYGEALLLPSA